MSPVRLLQVLGPVTLLVWMAAPRIGVLRPYARRMGIAMAVIYITLGIGIVLVRIVVGPGPFMD
jgi:hypothetical protein